MSLRDEIAKLYCEQRGWTWFHDKCSQADLCRLFADSILSITSGLIAVKECGGDGGKDCYGRSCPCHGTGTITRDLTVDEAIELLKKIIDDYFEEHPLTIGDINNQERVMVKK